MATHSRGRTETMVAKQYQQDKDHISSERTRIWIELKQRISEQIRVSVVYYLSRNGQLEHPHFLEVPLSSPNEGLYLRDVINRLNILRGQGMANMHTWSSKRSYRNGYVWQDLCENDFINPCHGTEYILKGSQFVETSLSFQSCETTVSLSAPSAAKNSFESSSSSKGSNCPPIVRRKNHSQSSTFEDLISKYRIYKPVKGINASTQTDDSQRQRRLDIEEVEQDSKEVHPQLLDFNSEAIESLKSGSDINVSADIRDQMVGNERPSGRMKAFMVLKQLIRCGSKRADDCASLETKD